MTHQPLTEEEERKFREGPDWHTVMAQDEKEGGIRLARFWSTIDKLRAELKQYREEVELIEGHIPLAGVLYDEEELSAWRRFRSFVTKEKTDD